MEKEKEFKSFGDFTNLYELSKTLRFELKPVGNTQKMLDEADVFGKDKIIKDKYEKTKPFIDRLHREFVDEALSSADLTDLKKYKNALDNLKNDKKNKEAQKELKKEEERLRKEIVNCFDETAKNWVEQKYQNLGLKKKDIGVLFEEGVFGILKNKYGVEENSFLKDEKGNFVLDEGNNKISIFDEWKGFVGYFTKFQETRKNFYKNDGTETALATRIVDQNLKRFCDNIDDFKKIKNKIDFSEAEKNFGKKADGVFSLDFYNNCLLQNGIDSYNEFLGGKTLEKGGKLKGINELVNEYRQKNKNDKVSFLKKLDKQLLSEKEGIDFIKEIKNDEHLVVELKDFLNKSEDKIGVLKKLFSDFVSDNDRYELDKIYFSKIAFNTISRKWTGNTQKFEELLYNTMKGDKPTGLNYDKNDNSYKFPDFIALSYFKEALQDKTIFKEKFWKDKYYTEDENKKGFLVVGENAWEQFLKIFDSEFKSLLISVGEDKKEIGFEVFKKDFEKLINQKDFSVTNETKAVIKNFADSVLWIYQLAKYFAVEKKRGWDDSCELGIFYTNPDFGYLKFYDDAYEDIVQKYNLFRNYLTKKPYSEDKWKLNFENPTLSNGWDKNKESDNSTIILRKNGKYYLGLMSKGNNKVFDDRNKDKFSGNIDNGKYEKVIYKYLPDAAKMIPKCTTQLKDVKNHFNNLKDDFFVSKSFIEPFRINKRIFDLNNIQYDKTNIKKIVAGEDKGIKIFQKEYYKLSGDSIGYKSALTDWIDFCKYFIAKYDSTKDFDISSFRKTTDYNSLDEFYNDVAKIAYKISFQDISKDYIDQKNQNGELYLFEIYNQDFAKGKTGTKNLHTMYFENLFSNENILKNFPLKLNGQAELFFRPKTEIKKLGKKLDKNKKEVINKKRYSEDKIFFHCPITLNREAGSIYRFNDYINNFISENKINIIGVDRGEKHLAYYSIIDQKGTKIDGGSFNIINNIDYAKKLEVRAGDNIGAKQNWQEIAGIKDLKKGYISQVVRKLADLAIEHNAIIVLEDLNMRFKQIRGGIEKSIYQQLERALIDKLSFLVEKGEKDAEQAGHLLKAYQLTAPFVAFKDMGKQTGIVFYTQASYTSKTCPNCGFRKNINTFRFENNNEKAKDVLKRLNSFEFDDKDGGFKLVYSLDNFFNNEQKKISKRGNILFSDIKRKDKFALNSKGIVRYRWHNNNTSSSKKENTGEKIENRNGSGVTKKYDITECLKGLFGENKIDYKQNLLEQIAGEKQLPSEFYKRLFTYLNLLLDIRNSISGTDVDYISCPECSFDSNESKVIKNGDDNGAYNIARKGIMVLEKIKKYKKDNGGLNKFGWGDMFIDLEEWDKFSQSVNNNNIDK